METPKLPAPTESELEILQVLWQKGPSTVRQVNDILNEKREIGYTTTLKLLQIMAEKRLVVRDTSDRVHIYEAAVEETLTQQHLLKRFVETLFRGSASQLVMQALGNHEASAEELDEIKSLIEKIEQQPPK
jgi:BlaI family penicillinase repressor